MDDSMSITDCVMTISAKINNFLDQRKLSHVFVAEERREEGPGKAIAAFIIPVLHPLGLKQQ